MSATLKLGAEGKKVRTLQKLLSKQGYRVAVDGVFGRKTLNAVKAFQSQNLDPNGQPLAVDGIVGPLTWWSLRNPKPDVIQPAAINFMEMPPEDLGGSEQGRAALSVAIGEMRQGACEIGGNNRGPWVRKYLNDIVQEPASWCAAFVSWCLSQIPQGTQLHYSLGARDIMKQMKNRDWTHKPGSGYNPLPGDLVFWWRVKLDGWQGHIGFVHQCQDGILYTIEGNKSPRVQGFLYVLSRMERLLGFGHLQDNAW
jgi:hypothetical protein